MLVPYWQQLQKEGGQKPKKWEKTFTIIRGTPPPPLSIMTRYMPAFIIHDIGIPLTYSINDDALRILYPFPTGNSCKTREVSRQRNERKLFVIITVISPLHWAAWNNRCRLSTAMPLRYNSPIVSTMMPTGYYVRSSMATATKGGRSVAKEMREIVSL